MSTPTVLFDEHYAAIHRVVMALDNTQFIPKDGDPRNLDPEDEPLAQMHWVLGDLELALDAFRDALRDETRRREAALDEMSEAEYEAWEAATA